MKIRCLDCDKHSRIRPKYFEGATHFFPNHDFATFHENDQIFPDDFFPPPRLYVMVTGLIFMSSQN